MVALALGDAQGKLCIDRTEVTVAEWETFVASLATSKPKLPATCAAVQLSKRAVVAGDAPDAGVRGVTWCGAAGYCEWAGKRLCGKTVTGATTIDTHDPGGPTDEWALACTDGKGALAQAYPYGNAYVQATCDVDCSSDPSKCHPAAPGQYPGCVTKSGIRDLSGSVSEWTAICDDVQSPKTCLFRGGNFGSNDPVELGCGQVHGVGPGFPKGLPTGVGDDPEGVGFRCCAYVP